jgi:hypothetical protein
MALPRIPRIPRILKTPVKDASDAGFVAATGQHGPLSVIDGLASGATLVTEGAELAGKYIPKMAGAAEALTSNPVVGKAVTAAPYLWAANMALQAADVAQNPEANKQQIQEVSNYTGTTLGGVPIDPSLQRAWYGVNNPVKTIAGAAQLTGDLGGTVMQNYQDEAKMALRDSFKTADPSQAGPVGIGRALDAAFSPLQGGIRGSRSLNTSNDPYARAAIEFLSRISADKIHETLKTGGPRNTSMGLLGQSGQTPEQITNQIKMVSDRSVPTANPSQLATTARPSVRDYESARSNGKR